MNPYNMSTDSNTLTHDLESATDVMTQRDSDPDRPDETTPPSPPSSNRIERTLQTIGKFTTISQLLRMLGAIAIMGAMSIFLMMGWHDGNDIQRYFTLLAQTLLLAGGGFALSSLLKEYKGARVFFGLGLLSVTANFTILGALIYSIVQFDGNLMEYPKFATWAINDPSNVLLTILGAVLVLIPVTLFAFAVLARSNAKWLTITYLFANVLLLVPVRASVSSAVLSVMTLIGVFYFIHKFIMKDEKTNTAEGKFAKAILFIPSTVMVFRSWYFYEVGAMAIALLLLSVYLGFRYISTNAPENSRRKRWLDMLSIPMVGAIPFLFVVSIGDHIADKYLLVLLSVVALSFVIDMLQRLRGDFTRVVFSVLAASLVFGSVVCGELLFQAFLVSLMSFAVIIAATLFGYICGNKVFTFSGLISAALLLVVNASEFVAWLDFSKWFYLSILGVGAIVFASFLERYGPTLKMRFDEKRSAKILESA